MISMKKLVDVENKENYAYWMIASWDCDFYTIGDFKKFIADNNIPDDAALEVGYDGGYTGDPNVLFYDKKNNKVRVKIP